MPCTLTRAAFSATLRFGLHHRKTMMTKFPGGLFALLCMALAVGCAEPPSAMPTAVPPDVSAASIALPSATASKIPPATSAPTSTPRSPLSGSGGGVLAFTSDRSGRPGIFVMNADGTDQRLVTDRVDSQFPDFSPDGKRIAFTTAAPYMGTLSTTLVDGSGQVALLSRNRAISAPDWHPDGKGLVFIFHTHQYFSISVMGIFDGDYTPLTKAVTEQINASPHWSPDGSHIVFSSDRDGNPEIYVMDANGGNVQRLTNNDTQDYFPTWSPDGSQIAFASLREGNWDLYVMDAKGRNVRRLTEDSSVDWEPAWSPDGTRLAFSSDRDGDWEIYVMQLDGSGLTQLTDNAASDTQPTWRPD